MLLAIGLWTFARALVHGSAAVALENVALRHQLAVLQRSGRRPKLHRWDRLVWVGFSRLWSSWRSTLVIVQPATVLAWHRQGVRLYWRWKSRSAPRGRPPIDAELRRLIRRMARDNPTWGRRRIHAALTLLGYKVAALTVAKYMGRPSPPPSPSWRAFLETHVREMGAVDFFVVPTLTFRLLFGFVVLRHHRRELLHVNVIDHPTAPWTAHQIVDAFPDETAPRYLLRDRDAIYGDVFHDRVDRLGIHEVSSGPTHHGKILSPSGSSAPSGENASTTSSCSTSGISAPCSALPSRTTTPRAHIRRSATTARAHEKSNRPRTGTSWLSLRWVASIAMINARPDHRRRRALPPGASGCGPSLQGRRR